MSLTIFCLCANWCDVCRSFQSAFLALGQQYPEHRYVWIDIEDHDDLLGDIDIENFPTMVITSSEKLYFFGPIVPHVETLLSLCAASQAGDLPAIKDEVQLHIAQQLLAFAK